MTEKTLFFETPPVYVDSDISVSVNVGSTVLQRFVLPTEPGEVVLLRVAVQIASSHVYEEPKEEEPETPIKRDIEL
jgi:hypothetical protein